MRVPDATYRSRDLPARPDAYIRELQRQAQREALREQRELDRPSTSNTTATISNPRQTLGG